MTAARRGHATASWRLAVAALLYLAAGGAGWLAGYGFGQRAGGAWVAIIAGVNSAVFCTLLADEAASRWLARERARRPISSSSSGRTDGCSG